MSDLKFKVDGFKVSLDDAIKCVITAFDRPQRSSQDLVLHSKDSQTQRDSLKSKKCVLHCVHIFSVVISTFIKDKWRFRTPDHEQQ